MTLGHRQALAELERVRASRDVLQVIVDDLRRQMRSEELDLRDPIVERQEASR